MRSSSIVFLLALSLSVPAVCQQSSSTPPPDTSKSKKAKAESAQQPASESKPQEPARAPEAKPEPPKEAGEKPSDKEEHFDMTEIVPVVMHHQITVDAKALRYTTTTGRMPIKRGDGRIDAEMFFVAYTLDGQEAGKRPLTFCFNGGPGSATVWLHMGAVGPKQVVLESNGIMPAAPYRITDNQNTLLDRSDLVFVDAIATGFSRAANAEMTKKFLGVQGDIEAFGEFIRMYITRYDRWTSPLFILGESYGTTRAAGVAGYLADHGISFNGIVLLSTVLNFETLEFTKTNDQPYILILPSYTMIAAYHKKLPAELVQDLAKTRQEAEHWASTEYAQALAKGDALTPQERQAVID